MFGRLASSFRKKREGRRGSSTESPASADERTRVYQAITTPAGQYDMQHALSTVLATPLDALFAQLPEGQRYLEQVQAQYQQHLAGVPVEQAKTMAMLLEFLMKLSTLSLMSSKGELLFCKDVTRGTDFEVQHHGVPISGESSELQRLYQMLTIFKPKLAACDFTTADPEAVVAQKQRFLRSSGMLEKEFFGRFTAVTAGDVAFVQYCNREGLVENVAKLISADSSAGQEELSVFQEALINIANGDSNPIDARRHAQRLHQMLTDSVSSVEQALESNPTAVLLSLLSAPQRFLVTQFGQSFNLRLESALTEMLHSERIEALKAREQVVDEKGPLAEALYLNTSDDRGRVEVDAEGRIYVSGSFVLNTLQMIYENGLQQEESEPGNQYFQLDYRFEVIEVNGVPALLPVMEACGLGKQADLQLKPAFAGLLDLTQLGSLNQKQEAAVAEEAPAKQAAYGDDQVVASAANQEAVSPDPAEPAASSAAVRGGTFSTVASTLGGSFAKAVGLAGQELNDLLDEVLGHKASESNGESAESDADVLHRVALGARQPQVPPTPADDHPADPQPAAMRASSDNETCAQAAARERAEVMKSDADQDSATTRVVRGMK